MITQGSRLHLLHSRVRRRGESMLLLAPERGFVLRGTAPEILALLDGERTVGEIVMILAASFESAPETIEADVIAFLDGLVRRGLARVDPCPEDA